MAARDASPAREAWAAGRFEWITSDGLTDEFVEVSSRVRVRRYLTPERAALFVNLIRTRATLVVPAVETPPCRDPKDATLIGTAIAGEVDYLVTSDKDLLDDPALRDALTARGIEVITADKFWRSLSI